MVTFPALLHVVPEPRWQHVLIPLRNASELDDLLGSLDDPAGWAAGCRLIDATRRIQTLAYGEEVYEFQSSEEILEDAQLRQLICRNFAALGCDASAFEVQTRDLSGRPLFEAFVEHAANLPEIRPSVRALVLVAILLLISAAFVVPGLLLLWLLP
jgi:hypothetical protein